MEEREGFSKTEKANMLLSPATRLGLRITNICKQCKPTVVGNLIVLFLVQLNHSLSLFDICSLSLAANPS